MALPCLPGRLGFELAEKVDLKSQDVISVGLLLFSHANLNSLGAPGL